ncbi:uncharacterized protein LY89DRAFT_741087 [Mollisia scopiformis]|uniref:Uncharacterized protein n=1 Tax=Mollisia scopiformis TaxID=149040 RepID=A0A132BAG6_MOLSC|nr:uncharacterized protein LY89DRAFT_741087 [Mollisia scopiformis]KUJ09371.1 hypothetical protein LY89DRAFT_741087 [Mollisia scopiformis]
MPSAHIQNDLGAIAIQKDEAQRNPIAKTLLVQVDSQTIIERNKVTSEQVLGTAEQGFVAHASQEPTTTISEIATIFLEANIEPSPSRNGSLFRWKGRAPAIVQALRSLPVSYNHALQWYARLAEVHLEFGNGYDLVRSMKKAELDVITSIKIDVRDLEPFVCEFPSWLQYSNKLTKVTVELPTGMMYLREQTMVDKVAGRVSKKLKVRHKYIETRIRPKFHGDLGRHKPRFHAYVWESPPGKVMDWSKRLGAEYKK